jgi:hypothetical protein
MEQQARQGKVPSRIESNAVDDQEWNSKIASDNRRVRPFSNIGRLLLLRICWF